MVRYQLGSLVSILVLNSIYYIVRVGVWVYDGSNNVSEFMWVSVLAKFCECFKERILDHKVGQKEVKSEIRRLQSDILGFDPIKSIKIDFGSSDDAYVLWCVCVRTWNALWMNKQRNGNDYEWLAQRLRTRDNNRFHQYQPTGDSNENLGKFARDVNQFIYVTEKNRVFDRKQESVCMLQSRCTDGEFCCFVSCLVQ